MRVITSIFVLAYSLAGVHAASIEKRQVGIVNARLFTDTGCQESSFVSVFNFVDDGTAKCTLTDFGPTIKCIRVQLNGATRQCKCKIQS